MMVMIAMMPVVVCPVAASSPDWPVDRCPVESGRTSSIKSAWSREPTAHRAWPRSSRRAVSHAHRAGTATHSTATHSATAVTATASTAVTTTATTASTAVSCHGGRAEAQCRN
jgi:hypothetical protein